MEILSLTRMPSLLEHYPKANLYSILEETFRLDHQGQYSELRARMSFIDEP